MSATESVNQPWTVARLLAWTKDFFERREIESARLCAEILLAHAMSCKRIELYTQHELVPAADVLDRFRASVREAGEGKPIAYLTGTRDFFSLQFAVTPDVLIPRPETEVLVERTISLLKSRDRKGLKLLDIGTGSGCIAIALAKNLSDLSIVAVDISEEALGVARKNANALGVAERIDFRGGDLFETVSDCAPFDVIVSNPPYIGTREAADLPRNVRDFEPHQALFAGDDGLTVLRRIAVDAMPATIPGGHLLLEVAYDQSATVVELLKAAGWVEPQIYKDDLRHDRVVHVRKADA